MNTTAEKDTRLTDADLTPEKLREINEALDRAEANGDEEERRRILRTIPMYPRVACGLKELMGKERLLKSGINLVEAERAYGKDWLDK